MVYRRNKRSRKYLGMRSWGVGNIKNNRGKGSRGGVGKGGGKHKFTRTVLHGSLKKVGFSPYRRSRRLEINLDEISRRLQKDGSKSIELRGYKVLGGGRLSLAASIKADSFSKGAEEKIKAAGGEAVRAKASDKDMTSAAAST